MSIGFVTPAVMHLEDKRDTPTAVEPEVLATAQASVVVS
jgi:hypothetical protein